MFGNQPTAALLQAEPFASNLVLLFALLVGHAIGDFALQGKFVATAKNRHADLSPFFGELEPPKGLWFHILGAHSLIHAAPVWLLTGSVGLALLETLLHWVIDFAQCERWIGFNVDQALHVLCKITYVLLLSYACPLATWSP